MTRVVIAPYSKRWRAEFARLGRQLRAVLADRALRIDHVGSTAVRGLDAKDRIDVQVVVSGFADGNALGGEGFVELSPAWDRMSRTPRAT